MIVLGVLIALGAQQFVDELQWRKAVRLTEEALASEIAASVVHSAERQMVYPCLRARLNQLVVKMNADDSRWVGDPMPLGDEATVGVPILPAAYRTPDRNWDDSVWEAAKSSGVFTHMPRQRVAAYSNLYAMMETKRIKNVLEVQTYPRLLYLSYDTTMDSEARQQALSLLGVLDWLNGTFFYDSREFIDAVRDMRLDFSRTTLKRDLAAIERTQRAFRGNCVRHVEIRL